MNKVWPLWLLTSLYFFFEWMLRVSPSIISTFLEQELHSSLTDIGNLSVFFYYSYLLMQIPVGIIVDRCDVIKVMIIAVLVFGVATIMFSQMPNIYYGYASRLLMGLSGSFAFVGTVKIITLYFRTSYNALLTGITQGLGMLGAVIGMSPMYYCFVHYGWHRVLLTMSIIFFIIGIMLIINKILLINKKSLDKKPLLANNLWLDIKYIATSKIVWLNAIAVSCFYAPTVAFGEQWGVSFFVSTNLTFTQATSLLSFMFIGMTIGCPILGLISDVLLSRITVMVSATLTALILMIITIYAHSLFTIKFSYLLMFIYGFCQGALVVFYTMCTELVPIELTGFCIWFTNMASVMIGAGFIQIMAYILQYVFYHQHHIIVSQISTINFQRVFILFPLSFIISLLSMYFLLKHIKKQNE